MLTSQGGSFCNLASELTLFQCVTVSKFNFYQEVVLTVTTTFKCYSAWTLPSIHHKIAPILDIACKFYCFEQDYYILLLPYAKLLINIQTQF